MVIAEGNSGIGFYDVHRLGGERRGESDLDKIVKESVRQKTVEKSKARSSLDVLSSRHSKKNTKSDALDAQVGAGKNMKIEGLVVIEAATDKSLCLSLKKAMNKTPDIKPFQVKRR